MTSGSLVAISGFLLCAPLDAQVKPTFGVEGGFNFAKINIESSGFTVSFKNRTGFAIGGFLETALGNTLILQPHLLFSQQGTKYSDGGASFTIKLDYIHIPVLVRYNIPMKSSSATPFVVAGPYLGVKAGCTTEYEDNSGSVSGDCGDSAENDFKSTDLGLSFGAGVGYQKFLLSLRYSLGLTSIVPDDPNNPDSSAKNRMLSLLVGYRL